MSSASKDTPKTPPRARKWVDGGRYKCVVSKSPGYKIGEAYICHNDPVLGLCLTGRDGYKDPVGMLVSGFVDEK